jgi:hypothetical protein
MLTSLRKWRLAVPELRQERISLLNKENEIVQKHRMKKVAGRVLVAIREVLDQERTSR